MLLEHNFNIDEVNIDRIIALILATRIDELVDMVENSANLTNEERSTALIIAIEEGYEHIAQLIRNHINELLS